MVRNLHALANPTRFLRLSGLLLPVIWLLALGLLGAGLYMSFFTAPPDYQQGETVRIMFIHVPAAWLSLFGYTLMAGASATALIFRHPLADVAAKSAAPVGAAFTFLALVTGALWGKPMWGTWWVWDARLTSVLILFFLYLGYMALWATIEEPVRAARAAAVLALVGFVNVPIIHYSVEWWNTLHQGASVLRLDGPAIHPSMLWPLLVMALGSTFFFLAVMLTRMQAEIYRRRVRQLQLARASAEAGAF
ncbi:heme ABC transporter permease [Tepidicaulis sp.]|jgi:heme exporter protein C|uniref:heme ABC transporter permease n=1 Tax=Tepidicaulis sp. TaxID=1920809 RepID=UPI003B590585